MQDVAHDRRQRTVIGIREVAQIIDDDKKGKDVIRWRPRSWETRLSHQFTHRRTRQKIERNKARRLMFFDAHSGWTSKEWETARVRDIVRLDALLNTDRGDGAENPGVRRT